MSFPENLDGPFVRNFMSLFSKVRLIQSCFGRLKFMCYIKCVCLYA